MIKTYRPTSAGIRARKTLVKKVTSERSLRGLTKPLKGSVGRNNGRISIRHRQRGARKHYRIIDFKRDKHQIIGKVARLEHDPNRGCNIALINYIDGEKRYILAPEGLEEGMNIVAGADASLELGNALPLDNIPMSTKIHNVEINIGKGGQIARGAGNYATVMAKEGDYVSVKFPSGEVKKIFSKCYATIGTLGNADHRLIRAGKAGLKRHLGWRPEVRGVAMANPTDHPHAGSYRDNGVGMTSPKTPWGKKGRGKLTRARKYTSKFIAKNRRDRR